LDALNIIWHYNKLNNLKKTCNKSGNAVGNTS